MRRHYSAIFALQQGRCPSLNFFAGYTTVGFSISWRLDHLRDTNARRG